MSVRAGGVGRLICLLVRSVVRRVSQPFFLAVVVYLAGSGCGCTCCLGHALRHACACAHCAGGRLGHAGHQAADLGGAEACGHAACHSCRRADVSCRRGCRRGRACRGYVCAAQRYGVDLGNLSADGHRCLDRYRHRYGGRGLSAGCNRDIYRLGYDDSPGYLDRHARLYRDRDWYFPGHGSGRNRRDLSRDRNITCDGRYTVLRCSV